MPAAAKPEEYPGERQNLLRWARAHLSEYRQADKAGDAEALLNAAGDLNVAVGRLLELAELNGPVGRKRAIP